MATFGRSLCLILTLWMTGSSTSTVILPRSPESSSWLDQASLKLQQDALRLRKAGDFRAAELLYMEGYQEAVSHGDNIAAVRYVLSAGGCQLLAFQYRAALASFLEARQLATRVADSADLGAIAVNLSSLYLQVWDQKSATRAAEEGLRQAAFIEIKSQKQGRPRETQGQTGNSAVYFKAHLLVQLGRIYDALGDGRAGALFYQGIEAARAQGDLTIEALAWDLLGEEYLGSAHWQDAQRVFLEAYRLRRLFRPGELGISYGHLGALALAGADFQTADRLTHLALGAVRRGAPALPEYLLLQQRGRIQLARHHVPAALHDFSLALTAAAQWRAQVLPARSSLISSNIALEKDIFQSFIYVAAEYALKTKNPNWAERAFQAVEMNRAASLRESLVLAGVWRDKLPTEYWEMLGRLGAEEAKRRNAEGSDAGADNLRSQLTEMEAQTGIGFQFSKNENFRSRISLIRFQRGLKPSELFLSFKLGQKESYLWVVSRRSLKLYRLAGKDEIAKSVEAFRQSLTAGGPPAVRRGRSLYLQLFGQLDPQEAQKPAWLLSLDGALFDLPFAALVTEPEGNSPVYLIDNHSLQTVPGALLLGARADTGNQARALPRGQFLGVGDAIYNQVDPRWRGLKAQSGDAEQLQRLVGSREEVETSAAVWGAGGGTAVVLQGAQASRDTFLHRLEARPAVIHLATHVLFPSADRERGLIAFGLVRSRRASAGSEFLTTSEIAGLRVPGALVVMTGCASGSGEAPGGAGLLGLTRAWLMAGASSVISTAWPVEDSSGGIFARFYFHLRNHSAAEALQLSQREAAHSSTGRQAPESWASYQVTGGNN